METSQVRCPSCGAPLQLSNRFVRMVTCGYCGSLNEVLPDHLASRGKVSALVPLPTRFRVGQSGSIQGQRFSVLGRVRYGDGDAVWDEWLLGMADGALAWLEEDEGQWILGREEPLRGTAPPQSALRVGERIVLNGRSVVLTERCTAKVIGVEGELRSAVAPGEIVTFYEGSDGEGIAYLEYASNGVGAGYGRELARREVTLDS